MDYQPNFTNKPSYRLQVTIESIKLGSMSDFKNMSLSGVPHGSSPTYVRVTIKNLSGKAIGTSQNDPFNSIQALVNNQELDSATIGGYFADCPQPNTPNPLKAGQSFSACETFFTKGEATQIGYLGSSATLNSPVSWSP